MSQQNKTFLEIADRIGCRLCRDAVWDANRCSWLGWSMEPVNNQWTTVYRSFAADLYGGTSGIASGVFKGSTIGNDYNATYKKTGVKTFR